MNDSTPSVEKRTYKKAIWIVVAVIVTCSLSGFFMGLRQTVRDLEKARASVHDLKNNLPREEYVSGEWIPNSVEYRELPNVKFGPNREWKSDLRSLVSKDTLVLPSEVKTEAPHAVLAVWKTRRAFNGAPPTVPHPVDQDNSAACLLCHGQETHIGEIAVPQMSHKTYTSCTQCHVPENGVGIPAMIDLASFTKLEPTFEGDFTSCSGDRAHAHAPPTIPHTTWMRENCMSCHGPEGSSPLRTSHPERQSCVQCHVPDAELDQRVFLKGSNIPL